ncbi:hypothetical protein [Actinocrispum sp. NPDC049592]|uniref:hypothetical protein n=1 Tax=Actinocrispum sp. NPDC049592 TaxID=3154835 RepID=UPI003427B19A
MPKLQPHHVWLIGIPLNLLLSIPAYYVVVFVGLAGVVIGGEFGWTTVDPTLVDDGVGIPIGMGVAALVLGTAIVVSLNAFAFRSGVNHRSYWPAVFALVVVPNLFLL